ncbi:MAG: TRAP transporter TatT component family protein [Pseudomonadota bacterium]
MTQSFADSLAGAILDNPDLAMVRDGAPAYLILIDSLVARSPDDAYLLQQSATLHGAYAGAFVSDTERARLLQAKARTQALQATCLTLQDACGLESRPYRAFNAWVDERSARDVPILYTLATSWAGWVQANSDDFAAIADLGKVKALLNRAVALQPDYDNGGLYLYLGVLETLFPPAMGGKPEVGRGHFEEAIARSEGQNLLAKVLFAEQYARLVFDRELHDRLLTEVMEAAVAAPGLTLMNVVAKEQAQQLLETADEYF